MTNKERVLRAVKRKNESDDFYDYCENMLYYFDFLSLTMLREFYNHNALPTEVRAYLNKHKAV